MGFRVGKSHVAVRWPPVSIRRLIPALIFVVGYLSALGMILAQTSGQTQSRIDQLMRDQAAVERSLASHTHPELSRRLTALEAVTVTVKDDLAMMKGGGLAGTALLAVLNLANMIGVRFSVSNGESNGG